MSLMCPVCGSVYADHDPTGWTLTLGVKVGDECGNESGAGRFVTCDNGPNRPCRGRLVPFDRTEYNAKSKPKYKKKVDSVG